MVYRLVNHDPPRAEDFVTHHEHGTRRKAPPCLRAGLSVFRTLDDVIHQRNLFPSLGVRVAKGALGARHGKTRLTPGKQPTHTTWWPYAEIERATGFSVVKESL